jgi:putative ABC transport system permease protein
VLTAAAIVLGTSIFVGMRTANETVLTAFSRTVDRIAGKTELQITAGDAGFGEDVLERVQAARTVKVAVPIIEAVVDSHIKGEGKLMVLAVDMTGDQSLREYDFEANDEPVVEDPLIFLAQVDSLILSKEFAARNNIHAKDHLRFTTVDGERMLTVRGLMRSSGLASAFGGSLAVMDVYAAQKMFGRGRTFDRIELARKPGVTLADCRQELQAILGPAFEIQPPSSRSHQFEAILGGYSVVVAVSSGFALLIAVFIIYNSFALAVTQRRHDIGILRALGATRAQIRKLFLAESLILDIRFRDRSALRSAGGARNSGIVGQMVATSTEWRRDERDRGRAVADPCVATGVHERRLAVLPARQAALVDPIESPNGAAINSFARRESLAHCAGGLFAVASVLRPHARLGFASYVGAVSSVGVLVLCPLRRCSSPGRSGGAEVVTPIALWRRTA